MIDPLAPLTEQELARSEVVHEPSTPPMVTKPVKFPVDLEARLRYDAEAAGIGFSTLVRQIVEAHYAPTTDLVAVRMGKLREDLEQVLRRNSTPLPPAAAA